MLHQHERKYVDQMSKICNKEGIDLGRFNLEGFRQPRNLKMRVKVVGLLSDRQATRRLRLLVFLI